MHPRKTSLHANPQPVLATKPLITTKKLTKTARQAKEDRMHALAQELGFFCTATGAYMVDLATTIARSIRARSSTAVYQSAVTFLPNFPLELARATFAFASPDSETRPGTTTWFVSTMDQTSQVFGSIFEDGAQWCSGASKAFKSASEPVVRVIATIVPGAVISHVVQKRGVERLYAVPR